MKETTSLSFCGYFVVIEIFEHLIYEISLSE